MKSRAWILCCLLLAGCGAPHSEPKRGASIATLEEIKENLAFTCKHEKLPAASADSHVVFKYARWLQKNNQLKQDPATDVQVGRLYRIAAENGHVKATINLLNDSLRGKYSIRSHEHFRFSQALIDADVATGYYFVSIFQKNGIANLKQDGEMSRRYLRKAADEGSAQAQYEIGDALAPSGRAPDVARQMRRCAAEQAHGAAANTLGVYLQETGAYNEAIEAFQLGVAAGNESSSSFLRNGFRGPEPTDELYYLGLDEDLERAERYKTIWRILARYSYAHPKVPEINDILPLPPAKLPPWDGKLQWLEAREANIPPEKPSPELIKRLTHDLKLDPDTGKPMPGVKGFSQAHLTAAPCLAGSQCPVSGYWQVVEYSTLRTSDGQPVMRHFEEGETFPVVKMQYEEERIWPLPSAVRVGPVRVSWRLV
jgi:TPR repeat protein